MLTCIQAIPYQPIHTYIQPYIRKCIHTYIHIYIHTWPYVRTSATCGTQKGGTVCWHWHTLWSHVVATRCCHTLVVTRCAGTLYDTITPHNTLSHVCVTRWCHMLSHVAVTRWRHTLSHAVSHGVVTRSQNTAAHTQQ